MSCRPPALRSLVTDFAGGGASMLVCTQDLQSFGAKVKDRLLPFWEAHHISVSRQPRRLAPPELPEGFMCRHASLALKFLLAEQGIESRVIGGQMQDAAGNWADHWWLEVDGAYLDITAGQFGHVGVLVASPIDSRYRVDARLCNSSWTNGLRATVRRWLAESANACNDQGVSAHRSQNNGARPA